MGLPSYYEDIQDRLAADLRAVSEQLLTGREDQAWLEHKVKQIQHAIDAANRSMENALRDLRNHIDLATDPSVNLAEKCAFLTAERDSLRKMKSEWEKERAKLIESLESEGKTVRALKADLKKVQSTLHFERMARADPESFYASYTGKIDASRS